MRKLRVRLSLTGLRRPWTWYRHRGLETADVLLASYPKSGSTWLRFLLGHLLTGRQVDFDTGKPLIPIVGYHRKAPVLLPSGGRLIKTHEPYRRQYRNAVYLVRDVRGVALSYYYHQLRQDLFEGEWSTFLPRFLNGSVTGLGTWDAHVESWLRSPLVHEGRIHVVRYEDMTADTQNVLRRLADFLDVDVTDRLIAAAVAANTLDGMREKEARATVLRVKRKAIPVVRKGNPGEWRHALDLADKAVIERRNSSLLKQLGYELTHTS